MLTRKEILALPAGQVLNALIAEHLFAWRRHEKLAGYWLDSSRKKRFYLPDYSTDWGKAGEVVDAMRVKGFCLKLVAPFTMGSKEWWASFDQHGIADSCPPWQAPAPLGPMAICRTALLTTLSASAPTPQLPS